MYSFDKDNFKAFLKAFPGQIEKSQSLVDNAKLEINRESVQNIVYLGMGGSAIAGDIISDIYFDELTVPLNVIRSYEVPGYCNKNTLVIASSYSGNTEEAINAVKIAHQKGAQILAIASGGQLNGLAKKNNWSFISVPDGFPPRQAFGYSLFPIILSLIKMGIIKEENIDIAHMVQMVSSIVLRNDEESAEAKVLSKDLAIRIRNKIPIVYSLSPFLKGVTTRWKNQFQENSKSMAFNNVIPEMNHNEIVGWEMETDLLNNLIVIFLENHEIHPRVNERIRLTKNIIMDKGIDVVEIYSEGESRLEQAISLVATGDWVSYYLALLYEKNPISILNIDYLKSELKKLG